MKNISSNIYVNYATGAVAAISIIAIQSYGVKATTINNATTATTDFPTISVNYIIPQSLMGQELDNVLFSDPEFKQYFDDFNKELIQDIDSQYHKGTISAIKYYRMKAGLTQYELAKIIGDSQSHISRWENIKKPNISSKNLSAIAKALNVPMEELLNGYRGK